MRQRTRNMEQEAVKNFLEREIFIQGIEQIKQFSKGQTASFYIKTKLAKEFTVKFYKNEADVKYAYNISLQLEENKELKVPRLYKLPDKYFIYNGGYYGLIFDYIKGSEIYATKISNENLSEIAEQYAIFQKSKIAQQYLHQDKDIPYYVNNLRQNYLSTNIRTRNKVKQTMYDKIQQLAQNLLDRIEKEHENQARPAEKIIHCDITKSNMLFEKGHFSSFLDTDSVCLSYVGRDIAEFVISTVLHYPIYRNKRKTIQFWYSEIDKRLHLSTEEYLYGLDIYYLYRLQCRLKHYREKLTIGKFMNFLEFIKLRAIIVEFLRQKKTNV